VDAARTRERASAVGRLRRAWAGKQHPEALRLLTAACMMAGIIKPRLSEVLDGRTPLPAELAGCSLPKAAASEGRRDVLKRQRQAAALLLVWIGVADPRAFPFWLAAFTLAIRGC
jgi:hypothetical protein